MSDKETYVRPYKRRNKKKSGEHKVSGHSRSLPSKKGTVESIPETRETMMGGTRLDFTLLNPEEQSQDEVDAVIKMRMDILDRFLSQFEDSEYVSASFDITTVETGSADKFEKIINKYDLDFEEVKNRFGSRRFVWSNDDIAISTARNPITGEYYDSEASTSDAVGSTSKIGFYGKKEDIRPIMEDMLEESEYIKDLGAGFIQVPDSVQDEIED